MRTLLACLLLAAAPASAEVFYSAESAEAVESVLMLNRSLRTIYQPAPVDKGFVGMMFDKLYREGSPIVSERGIENILAKTVGVKGGVRIIQADLVEPKDSESSHPGRASDAMVRRSFSSIELSVTDIRADEAGRGRAEAWTFTLDLNGFLVQVRHDLSDLVPAADGSLAQSNRRTAILPPSDPDVQRRFAELMREAGLLGKGVQA